MRTDVPQPTDTMLTRGPLRVEIGLEPLRVDVRRAGRRLVRGLTAWACEGEVLDRFVQLTEGVMAREALGFAERAVAAEIAREDGEETVLALRLQGGRAARLRIAFAAGEHGFLQVTPQDAPPPPPLEWGGGA